MKVSDVKIDPPVRMPNTSPASNVWLVSVKMTLLPLEDLFSLPTTEDTQAIDNAVGELNRLVEWRNTYVNSVFAKACGGLEIKGPASPVPQLLIITQPKNQPLAPLYGKVSAEWQVDHWQFVNVSLTLPKLGEPRASYQGAVMVKGTPEAQKVEGGLRDAIAQARKEIEAIRGRYTEQVVKGVKPGTTYTGTVSYRQYVAPCELRFLDPPPGGDARFAVFEIKLPRENPPCSYTYKARVTTELPIPVPGTQPAQANQNPTFDFDTSNRTPSRNIFQNIVRSSVKAPRESLPSYLASNDHGGQALLLIDGRIEGTISDFGAAPGIQLSVQQAQTR